LKKWKIDAYQDVGVWYVPTEGPVHWEFKEFAMKLSG